MVAGIAHEIATPVGIGLTAASQLEHSAHEIRQRLDADALTRAELEALLNDVAETGRIITNNLTHAAELMRSFKDVAVDRTGDDLRTIDLGDYLRDILANLGPRLRATPHKLLLDCPGAVTLTTRPGALTQIVTNFVMNSLSHAFPAGRAGTIDLSAWRDGGDAMITYGDDGVGVPPAIMSRLFEPGFTTRRGEGGTGLGLGIVHDLVTRKLGGSMTARNRPHGGLAFDLRLPADSPR